MDKEGLLVLKVDFCSWHGIGCSDDGHVVLLNLQSNNLVGSVLPEALPACLDWRYCG